LSDGTILVFQKPIIEQGFNTILFLTLTTDDRMYNTRLLWGYYLVKTDITAMFYSGCQNKVPMVGGYFVTTTYAAILFFGTLS
jgi:hypothetical protein